MVVVPAWLDDVPKIDYTPEKQLLADFESWATANGWVVTDGSSLPIELRRRTDVVFEKPDTNQRLRLAVLRKSRSNAGSIRVDSSDLLTVVLIYQRKRPHWGVEAGGIRFENDLEARGWDWLVNLLFQP